MSASKAARVQILDLLARSRFREAEELCRTALAAHPDDAELWYALSELRKAQRRFDEAAEAAQRAADRAPSHPFLQAHLALCLLLNGSFRLALECAERAVALKPGAPVSFDLLGQVYAACDEQVKAKHMFETELRLDPGNQHARFNLAVALRNVGELEAAAREYDTVIAHNASDWEAYKNRSDLRKATPARNHVAELSDRLERGQPGIEGEIQLRSALAKELEDLEHHQESFAQIQRMNALQRQRLRYDVAQDERLMQRIAATYDSTTLAGDQPGCPSAEPIFVVGLPRTGSTLLERILTAHSQVTAAGELQNFAIEMYRRCPHGPGVDRVLASSTLNAAQLGEAYVQSTRPRTGAKPYFVDKLPNNFLHLGAIHRALPNARIIHVLRDPMDTCFAIFKTLFKDGYPYSYALDDLGRYFIAYRRLMDHWRGLLGDHLFEVRYEDLVDDTEAVARQALAHCGLPFEDACLKFFENKTPVSTASAAQVRQPIYRSSIGRWRTHASALGPLLAQLRGAGHDSR